MPEIIMIFIVLAMLIIPVGVVIALVWYFSSRSKSSPFPAGPTTVQERLLAIEALRSQNLISDTEHEEKRKQILKGI